MIGLLSVCITGLLVACTHGQLADLSDVDFQRQVRPILSDHCFQCHGPDAEHREADLRLDQPDPTITDADDGIIRPGKPEQSELWRRITSTDPEERMPPPDSGKSLTAEQIATIGRWIQEGATWQKHWAFVPPKRPAVPTVPHPELARNAIDHFVLARLARESMQPAPPADRYQLIRRLSFDLTGLPPTAEQVDAFVGDTRPDAYRRLIDRLLQSPAFGERMTIAWLDQARYADTNGYSIDGGRQMSVWRDWVIHAYNQNMPFDQFLTEQLAGDLLPGATVDQQVATGFNRNHMITHEGGTIPEENLTNYAADRVKTTAEVFLGLTMGCAQCHDHKYDPISQRDYYRMFAYFNRLSDRGLDGNAGRNAVPKIEAMSVFSRDKQQIDALRGELAELQTQMQQPLPSQATWEVAARRELAQLGQDLELHPVDVIKVTSPNRSTAYEVLPDGTVYVPNAAGRSPSISAKIKVDQVTALRLVFYPDERFPDKGIGHGNDSNLKGSLLLTSFSASATAQPADQVDLYHELQFRTATASASHEDFPPQDTLDPRDHNGWSPHPANQTPQHITFQLVEPLKLSETPYVTAMLVWGGGPYGGGLVGGRYKLFAVTGQDDGTNIPEDVQRILAIPPEERSTEQAYRVSQYHLSVAPERAWHRYQIRNLRERIAYLTKPQEVMVMDVAAKPRVTHVLARGQYDQPLERVDPGTPAVLPPPPADAPANRLGLARWLVQQEHPLTSRVAVNRIWELLFGQGLVSTSADFGSQGDPPSHPELLDYLAVEFRESGWNVKRMIKTICMSATYRQSSAGTPEQLRRDPNNRLLARGPRFRLPAEMIRDQALAASGLLSPRVGGPSVRPYQPAGLWKEVSHYGSTPATAQVFVQDHGDRLFRRSLYTYWKRTSPPPSLTTFDAPTREVCTIARSRTNTPLQSLTMLNDPQFVEAAGRLAARILHEGGDTVAQRAAWAMKTVLNRPATDAELDLLTTTYQEQYQWFVDRPADAASFVRVGESPREHEGDLSAAEQAAWGQVAALLLNLSETITRE